MGEGRPLGEDITEIATHLSVRMFHYLANALKWSSGRTDGFVSPRGAPSSAAEAAQAARLREDEQAQRVLHEHRRVYTDFMTRTSLGRLLADHMPVDEGIFTSASDVFDPAVSHSSGFVETQTLSASDSLPHGVGLGGCMKTTLVDTHLEVIMIEALAPLLSSKAVIITRRALELVPQLTPVTTGTVGAEQVRLSLPQASCLPPQNSLVTLKEAQEALLPFLLVVVHIRRWQVCLSSLSAALSAESACGRDSSASASARVAEALQQLSHVLVAITCVTDLQAAAIRSHLHLLSNTVTSSVATTLQCLRRLTRAGRTEEFSLPPATASSPSLPVTEWIEEREKTARGDGEQRNMHTAYVVPVELIEKQGYRLLSLFLFWMELVHDIATPSLTVQRLFLTASTARFSGHSATAANANSVVAGSGEEKEAETDETQRCTGLSNAVLLHQVSATLSVEPLAMLSLGARDANDADGEGNSKNLDRLLPFASASDVADSLISLFLFASKGVVKYAPLHGESHTLTAEGSVVEEDSDLGLIVVLTSRLLRYMFITRVSSPSRQVEKVASLLLSAISVLLACFIAGDRKISDLDVSAEETAGVGSSATEQSDSEQHVEVADRFKTSTTNIHIPSSPPRKLSTSGCDINEASTPTKHQWGPARQQRLIGQLSCGLALLATLIEGNATSVVEAMDHSFVLDALITVLQVVGSRFAEPPQQDVATVRALGAASQKGADAWLDWMQCVEGIGCLVPVSCSRDGARHWVAEREATVEKIFALLHRGLSHPPDMSSVALSSNPYVDELLHAYLGLLRVGRLVRCTLPVSTASQSKDTSLGRNNALPATGGVSARQRRALETLDQLELTVVRTFLIADNAPPQHATPCVPKDTEFPITPQESVSSGDTDIHCSKGDMSNTRCLALPFESCLYNLLLKHILWCIEAHGQHCIPSPSSVSPKVQTSQHQQSPFAPPLVESCASPAMPVFSSNTPVSTIGGTSLLGPQPRRTNVRLSSPWSTSNPPSANQQQSFPATNSVHSSCAPVSSLDSRGDDPVVLFLVHHGLFCILLHDENFWPLFPPIKPTAAVETACPAERQRCKGEAKNNSTTSWQRVPLILYFLSRCMQMRVSDGDAGDDEGLNRSPGDREGSSFLSVTVSQHSAGSTENTRAKLSADDQLLAQRTVEALMRVLRTSPKVATAPCCSVVDDRRKRLCAYLFALLALAAAPQGAKQGGETSDAATAVCAALVKAGGFEYFLHTAAVFAEAGVEVGQASRVSCAWAMQATRFLVRDAAACVYMAKHCTHSLLSMLWHPTLRHDGQMVLEAVLCQPLVDPPAGVCVHVGVKEPSLPMVPSPGYLGGEGGGAATLHTVPLHCQRLCSSVWHTLLKCSYGFTPGASEFKLPDSIASRAYSFPVATADAEARGVVLSSLLSALESTFRRLGDCLSSCVDGDSGELLRLRTLQRALFEASQDGGLHIYRLLLHLLTYSWEAVGVPLASSALSPFDDTRAAEVCLLTSAPNTFLFKASDVPGVLDKAPEHSTATSTGVEASNRARQMVRTIASVLVGMTLANPSQREVLYRRTINEETLVNCIANAWAMVSRSDVSQPTRTMGEDDTCGMVRVCSYLIYESVEAVDAFFEDRDEVGVIGAAQHHRDGVRDKSWSCSLQSPRLLAAVLHRFTCLKVLTRGQQEALRKLLVSIIRTVEGCYGSLYLAASSAVHDMLGQLLPVVIRLPHSASSQFSPSSNASSVQPRLEAVLVRLLVILARCHMDVRQLKQLLLLLSHSTHERDRQGLAPLVVQVLSEALQPGIDVLSRQAVCHHPQHFIAFCRGSGPTGFRAALHDFPLEGYSVSLNVRWDGMRIVHGSGRGGDMASRQDRSCACIFSLRTTDRTTLLAFMIEERTGRFFVQYRGRQQQELRVYLTASLMSREWTHLCVCHRPAAFLTAAPGGQFMLLVNNVEVSVIPQVAYPLMSRGFFHVGCLGHDIDRLSVAHAFNGQVSTAYFFPYVLTERDRGLLQTVVSLADTMVWTSSSSSSVVTSPSLRPVSFSPDSHRAQATSGGTASVVVDEQWLAGRATVCVDTRLSDRGHLCNLSAVLRGRTGRDSRLFTMEGSLVCSRQRVMDSMGVLGALPSVLMPLCTLLVNPALPISSRGLTAAAQPAIRDSHLGLSSFVDPVYSTGATPSARRAGDTISVTVLRVLDLVPPLASAETIRNEISEARFFVFLGQMLELLGPSLQVAVPTAFVKLLEALAPYPRLFEDALTNLFLSADVIRAAHLEVQLTWVNAQRTFLSAHPETLPCLRTLGACMFVVAELLRVTAQEDSLMQVQKQAVATRESPLSSVPTSRPISASDSNTSETPFSSLDTNFSPSSVVPQPLACSLQDLENQWMAYFEALTAAPVALGDVEALQYFVENLHLVCVTISIQLRLLRRVRRLLVASATPYLFQLLGRKNYVVSLMPYLTSPISESVRLEALLQLFFIVLHSKRTQEQMNPILLASKDSVVHVAEEVSLSWLKDVLQQFPVNLPVYLALRCGLVGLFDVVCLPTQYSALNESQTIRFPAVLLPLLMLMKHATDTKLKEYILTDMAVLLKSDPQAWRRVITVRGWYVSVVGFYSSSASFSPELTCEPRGTSVAGAGDSLPVPADPVPSEGMHLQQSGIFFTTISMILSYTIFEVLLHETYGAAELELVVTYLREQCQHRLLHQVLCGIADRYYSRLMASPSGERRGGILSKEGPDIPSRSPASAFIGLGSATAAVNLCHFLRVVESVLFYGGLVSRREATVMATIQPAVWPFSSPRSVAGGEGVVTHLPVRVGYTEWDELMLVRSGDDLSSGIAGRDVFYAGEVDDPHGNVRRAILRNPDDRWLHAPLAVKCAELLCCHSALLHLGSNSNTSGLSIGGAASVVGSNTGGSGGPGDLLWSVVLGASPSPSVSNPIVTAAGGVGGAGVGMGSGGSTSAVLRGGMLRFFGRLFKVLCQMTLRSGAALNSVVELTDAFLRRIDREHRGSGFLLLKRAVNAENAREHSPIAITMTLIYSLNNLLLRRLHAAECGATSTYSNANAILVDRLKSLVQIFRYSFEQLPAFAATAGGVGGSSGGGDVLLPISGYSLLRPAAGRLPRGEHENFNSAGRGGSPRDMRLGSTYLDDLTGEVFTAGVSTLQWLCDHQANPRRTVEAFAEVASRADYNAFAERCLLAVEREQLIDKALAQELWPEQRAALRRLQELFAENSMARRLVHDKIRTLMGASNSLKAASAARDTDSEATGVVREGHVSVHSDDLTTVSFTSVFLPSAARRATTAARVNAWSRFIVALRGTLWSADAGGLHKTPKYVRLSPQEQQCLVHRKLIYDRDGTNYSGRALVSSSAPRSQQGDDVSPTKVTSTRAVSVLLRDGGDGGADVVGVGSRSTSASCISHRRLPVGESVLLQVSDDDGTEVEDMLNFSLDGRVLSTGAATSLSEYPLMREGISTLSKDSNPSPTSPIDDVSATPSILSVPCEVPYMMHCWSGSFTVRGSEMIVLIDDVNKAYNQIVAEEGKVYVLRPRPFSVHLSHITQIAPARRFRMRRTALEIWTRDRRSCFVNFADTATMNAALQMIRCGERSSYMFMAPSFLRDTPITATALLPVLLREGTSNVSRHSAYVLQENPRREPLRLRATALWRNRLLSNFDYLLVLNLLAGRTLNDLTQYPVFPWILSDYTSETLDLTNPSIFRDLSMPMGACGSGSRQELVRQRYVEMRDLGDVPAHYLTHYSSPAITLYFLIRLPPYTGLSILLQGGHFDHADRMFHSMQASFRAVMTSTQDVRELIPELYYLPELCLNANRVDFGLRQDRRPMHDLQLPPWSKNDPFLFVYRMREALESAHVSAHLHEWIDLIFGYKQRGKDAIDALNVFNWHSYEDLDRNHGTGSAEEQLIVDSLDNIGQTPIQLFRRPHQPRLPSEWADPLQLPMQVKVMTLRWGCVRVARTTVVSTDRVLVVAGSGAAASLRMHLNLIRQSMVLPCAASASPASPQVGTTTTYVSSNANTSTATGSGHSISPIPGTLIASRSVTPTADCCSFDVSEEYERRLAPIPAGFIPNNSPYADGSCTETSTALLCYNNEVFQVLGGFFDNTVMIRALSGASGDVRLRAHRGRVVVVAPSEDSRYLVTGAEDTTFAVWSCQLRQQLEVELVFTIYSHEGMPSAVDVSSTLDVVATASLNGTLMLHSLSTGELDRVIRHPDAAPIHRVLLQTTCYVPNILFLSHQDYKVHQYSLNGAPLHTFSPPGRVTTWAATANQCLLLACQPFATMHTGSGASVSSHSPHGVDNHASCILYLHSFLLEKLRTVPVPVEDVVSSLSTHPTELQVVVAGTESGRLLLLRTVLA